MSRFLRGYKAEEDMSEEDEERGIVVFDHFNPIAKRMIQETKELIIRLVRSMKLTPAERDALIAPDLTRLAKLSGNAASFMTFSDAVDRLKLRQLRLEPTEAAPASSRAN
ncbi:hypothetical protein F444_00265 [Phytophthora nicotianae P1976]|uniref:Uncharacterized protein n=1 Tax=Phytophthora nicotianae P1976 TaxID=1317066 RepID=A0A081B4V5_PHYNI|nr:hypothetical protein F444_00265 [Phytophthora nicotianae P1976]